MEVCDVLCTFTWFISMPVKSLLYYSFDKNSKIGAPCYFAESRTFVEKSVPFTDFVALRTRTEYYDCGLVFYKTS
jgi:hypothetical protein